MVADEAAALDAELAAAPEGDALHPERGLEIVLIPLRHEVVAGGQHALGCAYQGSDDRSVDVRVDVGAGAARPEIEGRRHPAGGAGDL